MSAQPAAMTSATACAPRLASDQWALQCQTCGHRPGQVTPTIAAAVVRSLPRRFDHRRAAIDAHRTSAGGRLADVVAEVRRHLADRAHRLLDGGLPVRRVDACRSGVDGPLHALADAIDAMTLRKPGPSDDRGERAWGEVSHFVHDAVHHLRMLDRVLEGALPQLVDIDLDDRESDGAAAEVVGEVGGDHPAQPDRRQRA